MPQQQVDYAALAAQAGGKPTDADYAALAQALGGSSDAPAAAPKQERSVGGFLGNVISSAGRLVSDTVGGAVQGLGAGLQAASRYNPINPQTARNVASDLATLKALPGAVKDAAVQRYGGIEQIKDTLYNDPIGALADVSTLAGGGALAAAGRAPRVAATLRRVEQVTNPLNAATAAAGRTGRRLQGSAVSAYERMLKPNKSTLEGASNIPGSLQERSRRVAEELIRDPNGQISKPGATRYDDATRALQQKVDEIVDANPEARGSTDALKRELDAARGRFAQQWSPGGDLSAYDAVAKDVTSNPRITKKKRTAVDTSQERALGLAPGDTEVRVTGREVLPRIRAATARELTQGTYRALGDKAYGELKGAATEAQKAAARGGRSILNEALPEVKPINEQIAKRIDLGQILDEAVQRSGKHDPIGLGQQIVLSGANPGFVLGSLINRPGIGSPLARGTYRLGGALTATPPAEVMRAALLARLNAEDGSEDQ